MSASLTPFRRYTDEEITLAKSHLGLALENLAVAFWSGEERFQIGARRSLEHAAEALGLRIVPDNAPSSPPIDQT